MTAQIPDQFRYEGEEYSLVGVDGTELYSAQDFGLEPKTASTACWRGHVMKYDCIDGELVLDGMDIRTDDAQPVNGVEAKKTSSIIDGVDHGYRMFSHTYENLRLKTKFTGSLMLGTDFIQSMYVHMGFQRAMCYRKVLEIDVQDGTITSVKDLSDMMEERRLNDRDKDARPPSHDDKDVKKWISDSFSQEYSKE